VGWHNKRTVGREAIPNRGMKRKREKNVRKVKY
jgi:hypothetical protein